MDKIKFKSVDGTLFFEVPWEWVESKNFKPKTNDIEAQGKRAKSNAYLFRKRQAQVPDYILPISVCLYRREILTLLNILKQEKYLATYFDHWADKVVTAEFYTPKPELAVKQLPYDNNYGSILYEPFEIEMIGYGDVS